MHDTTMNVKPRVISLPKKCQMNLHKDGDMVVPMKKNERPFPKNNERRISQFKKLKKHR